MISEYISNQLITVNTVTGNTRDIYETIFYENESWLNDLVNQTKSQSKIKKDRCEICSAKEEKRNLQLHHVAGRKFDFRMITVCLSCHRWLSDRQKVWDARWWNNSDNYNLKTAFFYMGIYDILTLKSKKTHCTLYEDMAFSYTEIISNHLKEAA